MILTAQSGLSIPPHVWKAFCGKHLRWQLLTKKHQTYLISVSKCHWLSCSSPEDIFSLTVCTHVCHPLSTDWEAWTLSMQFPHAVLAWGNAAHSWCSNTTAGCPEMDALNIQTYFLYQTVKVGTKHSKMDRVFNCPFCQVFAPNSQYLSRVLECALPHSICACTYIIEVMSVFTNLCMHYTHIHSVCYIIL